MRSFVIFALFALAICQSPLDIVTGFTTQLAFTDAQTQDVQNCIVGLVGQVQGLAPLYADYVNHDFQSLIAHAATVFQSFEPAVQAACLPLVEDLETYTVTFGNGQPTEQNTEINGAYIAQQVALLGQYAATQNYTGIGSTIGYIYQISIGAVDLPAVLPAQLTYDEAVAIQGNFQKMMTNQDDSLTQFLQAYVDAIGAPVNVTGLVQLALETPALVQIIQAFESAISTGDFDSDITAIEDLVSSILELVRANQQGLEAIATIDGAIVEQFVRNPLRYAATIIYNVLLNAPKIVGMDGQLQQNLIAGDFAAAGTTVGTVDAVVYGPVF